MENPYKVFTSLAEMYRTYYETPFALRDPQLADERRALLMTEGRTFREPFIEAIPRFKSSGKTVAEACADLGLDSRIASFLTSGLFPPQRRLYQHQWEAFRAAMNGHHVVVTSGTGSGKTEAFLLPILASLAQEALAWPAAPPQPDSKWWGQGNDWEPQRPKSADRDGVRALILYPMNALVQDQLQRLRSAVDGPGARAWYRDGNRFYFGRYTGQTPLAGQPIDATRRKRLGDYLREADAAAEAVRREVNAGKRGAEELYFFPQLDGGEMHSRWDMQEAPPDILITNYSMLNVMLMRKIEDPIFDITKAWLDGDARRIFTIVVDELHLYRGTTGSEVALLLRNLLLRLGLDRKPEQVRFIAASASLTSSSSGLDYLRQFFGAEAERFKVIPGERVLPSAGQDVPATLPRTPFEQYWDGWSTAGGDAEREWQAAAALAAALSCPAPSGKPLPKLLGEVLSARGVADEFIKAGQDPGTGELRPRSYSRIAKRLFGTSPAPDQPDRALDGLLQALAQARIEVDGEEQPLLPVRVHLFFRNIQGFWACSNPSCSEVEPKFRSPARKIGRIYAAPQWKCACGGRVLELLYCQTCGEAFLGGYKSARNSAEWALYPDFPELELIPDKAATQRLYSAYAWYWPDTRQPACPEQWTRGRGTYQFQFSRASLNPSTGVLAVRASARTGWTLTIRGKHDDEGKFPALPVMCPQCGDDWERDWIKDLFDAERMQSPIRTMRTGFEKVSQVLADALLRQMQQGRRQLVLFSDSRQDAAKLAAGLEKSHYLDLVRQLIVTVANEDSDPGAPLAALERWRGGVSYAA